MFGIFPAKKTSSLYYEFLKQQHERQLEQQQQWRLITYFLNLYTFFVPLFKNKKNKTKITWLDYFTQGDIRVCEELRCWLWLSCMRSRVNWFLNDRNITYFQTSRMRYIDFFLLFGRFFAITLWYQFAAILRSLWCSSPIPLSPKTLTQMMSHSSFFSGF